MLSQCSHIESPSFFFFIVLDQHEEFIDAARASPPLDGVHMKECAFCHGSVDRRTGASLSGVWLPFMSAASQNTSQSISLSA